MNTARAIVILAVTVLVFPYCGRALAHKTVPYRIEVAHGPVLQLDIPVEWQRLATRASPTFPTLVFVPKSGADFRVQVTPYWHSHVSLNPLNQADLENIVRRVFNYGRSSLRTDVNRYDFRALHSTGWYTTHIERVRSPAEFKYRASGLALSGRFVIHFMVLMNEGRSRLVDETVQVARSATDELSPYKAPPRDTVRVRWYEWFDEHGDSHCSEAKLVVADAKPLAGGVNLGPTMVEKTALGQTRYFHRVPVLNTQMVAVFPADGFRLEAVDENRGWYYFTKGPLGPSLSIEVAPALAGLDSESLGQVFAQAMHLDPDDARSKPTIYYWPERFIYEYSFPDIDGFRRDEGHLVTTTLVDGMAVVFHYSKLQYRAGDHHAFTSLVRGTKFERVSE